MDRDRINGLEAQYHNAVAMAADAPTADVRLMAEDVAEAILALLDVLASVEPR